MCGVEFSEGCDNLGEGWEALRTEKQYTIYFKTNPFISLLAEIAWFHGNRSAFQNFSKKVWEEAGLNLPYSTCAPRLLSARIL